MEYVKGKSLSDLLDEGLTLRRSVEIVASIAEALARRTNRESSIATSSLQTC